MVGKKITVIGPEARRVVLPPAEGTPATSFRSALRLGIRFVCGESSGNGESLVLGLPGERLSDQTGGATIG